MEEESKWPLATIAMEQQEAMAEREKVREAHEKVAVDEDGQLQVRGVGRRPSFLDIGTTGLEVPNRASHFRRNSVCVGADTALVFPWERGKTLDFVPARFEPDYQEATQLFFEDETQPKATKSPDATSPKAKPKGVLDGRRLYNLEISMKGLGVYTDAKLITRAFVDMDLGIPETAEFNTEGKTRKLDPHALEVILGLLPTVEESSLITSAPKDDLSRVSSV